MPTGTQREMCKQWFCKMILTIAARLQAYIDNLKATGQVENGCICGLDGTAWTGGLAVTAEEGAAIGAPCYALSPLPMPLSFSSHAGCGDRALE